MSRWLNTGARRAGGRRPPRAKCLSALAVSCLHVSAVLAGAPSGPTLQSAVQSYVKDNAPRILAEFGELVKHAPASNEPKAVRDASILITEEFRSRGIAMTALETAGAAPLLYGEIPGSNPEFTIGVYAHYDVTPVAGETWTHPPHEPTLLTDRIDRGGRRIAMPADADDVHADWRIYARGAGDDFANIMALLGVASVIKNHGQRSAATIKIILDGEEEIGSPHLETYRRQFTERFDDIDLWLMFDGPAHLSGRPHLVLGARGISAVEVTVFGATVALHSGHYGNWAPVPGEILARLLASMKDDSGRILIKGFYDDIESLDRLDEQAIGELARYEARLKTDYGLIATEGQPMPLAQRIMLPSLTIRGLDGGGVGAAARNVIPAQATASIEIRLVPGLAPHRARELLVEHIRAQGFHVVDGEPSQDVRRKHPLIARVIHSGAEYPARRIRLDHPIVRQLNAALAQTSHGQVLIQPMSGGTLPLGKLAGGKDVPVAVIPTANYDDNQHATDENLRIGNLWYAMRALAAVFSMQSQSQ